MTNAEPENTMTAAKTFAAAATADLTTWTDRNVKMAENYGYKNVANYSTDPTYVRVSAEMARRESAAAVAYDKARYVKMAADKAAGIEEEDYRWM